MIFRKTKGGASVLALTLGMVLAGATAAHAEDYPTQPIQAVVGFAAGGFADTIGRIFAQGLSDLLGQPVVVENQGGAGGNIAAARVAGAEPDGYTMLITTASITISQSLYDDLEYDFDDLTPAVIPVGSPEVLAAHP